MLAENGSLLELCATQVCGLFADESPLVLMGCGFRPLFKGKEHHDNGQH